MMITSGYQQTGYQVTNPRPTFGMGLSLKRAKPTTNADILRLSTPQAQFEALLAKGSTFWIGDNHSQAILNMKGAPLTLVNFTPLAVTLEFETSFEGYIVRKRATSGQPEIIRIPQYGTENPPEIQAGDLIVFGNLDDADAPRLMVPAR